MTLNVGHQGHAFTCEVTAPFPTPLHQGKGIDKTQQKLAKKATVAPVLPLPQRPGVHTEVARLLGARNMHFSPWPAFPLSCFLLSV